MPYATLQDLLTYKGEDVVTLLSDKDGDGHYDEPVVDRALAAAEGIVNSYLSNKYQLPLSETPTEIREAVLDIAVYKLADGPGKLTDDIRRRYEDVIAWLRDLAGGKAQLGVAVPPPSTGGGVFSSSEERNFGRGKMKGL